jgi:hypothetical protein
MARDMDLTDFRAELTEVIDNLDEQGPVRLMKYGLVVGELRSCTPEARKAEANRWRAAISRLVELEIENVFDFGLSLDDVEELFARRDSLKAQGATFSGYPNHAFPEEEGTCTVDQLLAYWYFGTSKMPWEPFPWFEACVDLQRMAHERGMKTSLPTQWDDDNDDENNRLVSVAIASGFTPDSLRQFAQQHLNQGVQLSQLDDLMGEDSVPADVVASPGFDRFTFDDIVKQGLPHLETVAVYRAGPQYVEAAERFAAAGLRTAQEIRSAVDAGLDPEMALRAVGDGMSVEQWRQELPEIKHLRYTGDGLLPVQMLIQAAREGLSLVRWDNSTLPLPKSADSFGSSRESRSKKYPWKHVVPDGVLDLARANITTTYVAEYAQTMHHHYQGDATATFIQDVISVHQHGLTVDMMKVLRRSDRKAMKFRPGPSDLIAILDEGVTVPQAHYLIERYPTVTEWLDEIRTWRDMQGMADQFLSGVLNTPGWAVVKMYAAATLKQAERYKRSQPEAMLMEAISRVHTPDKLMAIHVKLLLDYTMGALTQPHRVYGNVMIFARDYEHRIDDVKTLWTQYSELYNQKQNELISRDLEGLITEAHEG